MGDRASGLHFTLNNITHNFGQLYKNKKALETSLLVTLKECQVKEIPAEV